MSTALPATLPDAEWRAAGADRDARLRGELVGGQELM